MIRQAKRSDLAEIAEVHKRCFPDSFSTVLGAGLLTKYYQEYFDEQPGLFLLSEEEGKITGFCMGYLVGAENLAKRFVRRNAFAIAAKMVARLLQGNKAAWSKVKSLVSSGDRVEYLNEAFDMVQGKQKVDLLSICILPELRGSGVAQSLISAYEEQGRKFDRDYCILTVRNKNARGIRFYEKQGYVVQKRTEQKLSLIKDLRKEKHE